jgi:biopolymer transport protein ExbD
MIVNQQTSHSSKNNDDNLIPLINVVFLMLIFFMVAGHIESSDGVKVTPPQSLNEAELSKDKLTVVISKDSQLFIEGQLKTNSQLKSAIQHYFDHFSHNNYDKANIEIKADSQLTAQSLQAVLLTIKSLGIHRISLVTQSLENNDK